jgi:hypothetical protein
MFAAHGGVAETPGSAQARSVRKRHFLEARIAELALNRTDAFHPRTGGRGLSRPFPCFAGFALALLQFLHATLVREKAIQHAHRANTEEREAAGAMIVFLSRRWGIPPYLPNNVIDTPAAARFLASVGLDAHGRRKVNDV